MLDVMVRYSSVTSWDITYWFWLLFCLFVCLFVFCCFIVVVFFVVGVLQVFRLSMHKFSEL